VAILRVDREGGRSEGLSEERTMTKSMGRRGTSVLFAALGLAVLVFPGVATGDHAPVLDPNNGYGDNNRPAHVFVSVTDEFGIPDVSGLTDKRLRATADQLGTPVVRANLGTYVAGPNIELTRFLTAGTVELDLSTVPDDPDTGDAPDFDDNQATIVGSFKTLAPDSAIHMMTPYPGEIVARVQEAWFNASPFLDDAGALPPFPTTVEIALFVYDHQGDAGATVQEVLNVVFGTVSGSPVVEIICESPCEAEGVIFPHDPFEDGLFEFSLHFDHEEGTISLEHCLPVAIDLKPSASNNKVNGRSDKGVVPIAFLTTDAFDAVEELDRDTVAVVVLDGHEVLNSVAPEKVTLQDVDGDGDDDVLFHFNVQDLTAGDDPALTEDTETLFVMGFTHDGLCVLGEDPVEYIDNGK
jgi:hypothetical protein